MNVRLIWTTPSGDDLIAYMARVSNPENQGNTKTAPQLIRYLIDHEHWSPFEMANLCVEIECPRDIGRQILRHWTIRPQEFSQRYADVGVLPPAALRECRMQDTTNRQSSLPCDDEELKEWWQAAQMEVLLQSRAIYVEALRRGMAKEVARAVLPEGLTTTRMYLNGPIRSWIHFLKLRLDKATQKETREIAEQLSAIFKEHYPQTWEAVYGE